jgi:hypothetical protein
MHARRRKLIKTKLQLKLIGVFVGLACVSALIQTLLVNHSLLALLGSPEQGASALRVDLPRLLLGNLALSLGLLVPAMGFVGLLVTHRIAGPVYRFEQHLSAYARGEDPGPCKIRPGDELQELCTIINLALERARSERAAPASQADVSASAPTGGKGGDSKAA